jgi:hypothetical protein
MVLGILGLLDPKSKEVKGRIEEGYLTGDGLNSGEESQIDGERCRSRSSLIP